jgi:hypothetical protein
MREGPRRSAVRRRLELDKRVCTEPAFLRRLHENRGVSQIFISYRRQDAAEAAERLHEGLVARFGRDAVFFDIESLTPGADFADAMRQAVETSKLMLVVIGPQWASATGPDGRRRIDDPHDFIRAEVSAGLRFDRPIVPVLVNGAHMPAASELPEDLRRLTHFNAIVLGHRDWQGDLGLLGTAVERHLGVHKATLPMARGGGSSFLTRLGRAWNVLTGRGDAGAPPAPRPLPTDVPPPQGAPATPTKQAQPHAVFLSYSSVDKALVDRVVAAVEVDGPRCGVAHRDIPPAVVSWAAPIVTAISSSRLAVVLLTEHSIGSDEVLREVTIAADEKIPMLGVSLDATPLTPGLRYFFTAGQRVDLVGLRADDQVARVARAVAKACPAAA